MIVYLLHFDPPYRHARHYAGYTTEDDVMYRIERHYAGTGAKLTAAAVAAGTRLVLARQWIGAPRKFERHTKKRGMARLCPICNPGSWWKNLADDRIGAIVGRQPPVVGGFQCATTHSKA
jgi:hypothetical protein